MFPRFVRRPVSLACAALAVGAVPLSTLAQSAAAQLAPVFVTAQRTDLPIERVVADVSVIDRETIQTAGAVGVADLLSRLPGIEIARNGGPGTVSSVFLRGAESRFAAVYIDGVRVDSQATGGATWETLPTSLIDRIEVLRGPASAVYGSDALAGVVQIFTRRSAAAFAPVVSFGVGNQGTAKLSASASGAVGMVDYTVGLSGERSTGFNSRPVAGQNPDLDGYKSTSGQARVGVQLNREHRVEASVLGKTLDAQYDSGFPATADDHNKHKLQTASVQWAAQWTDKYRTRLVVTDSQSRFETSPSVYLTDTRLRGYALHNELDLGVSRLSAVLERKVDALQNAPIDQARSQNALALGYNLKTGAHTLQLNARRDQDSEFGGKTTGSAAYAFAFTPALRATASVGTGFRAPTLYQRFSPYGVASLKAESSTTTELGLRYAAAGTELSAVAYRSRVTNLITFSVPGPCVSAFGCYANTARAKMDGVTLAARHAVGPVALRASLDVQEPRDLDTDKLLARRARQHGTLGADLDLAGWRLGAEILASGSRFSSPGEFQPLPGYATLNLSASTRVGSDWQVFARLDNAANHRYQLINTYATPGRTVFVGVNWAPKFN